ncbi:hypothetical protein Tco_1004258 [Tanacetum coccineum]|uniref:Reverse transcriptase domain-containing protein n=1 Tax=Tanacetum coccineum TaxID=301880 RepID=A0ABQ5FBP5_9ASTR
MNGECDMPDCDDPQTTNVSTFSNPLFDDSTSSDDESSHEEVIHEMNFKTYSNLLFDLDEEINSSKFNPTHNEDLDSTPKNDRFDTEFYLLESLLNRDTFMTFSPKIDSLLEEFTDELVLLKPISPEIEDSNPEGDIRLVESLLYDNSSPRPPKAFQANYNSIIESLPISVDALREEIDILHGPDDSIPPGIESDDFDRKDGRWEDIPVDVPNILPTHPALDWISTSFLLMILDPILMILLLPEIETRFTIWGYGPIGSPNFQRFLLLFPVINTLLPFSSENEVKVFNHGVLASKEKSPYSLSHRGFKASKLFHQKSPMLIHGDNTLNLGVRYPHFYPSLTKLKYRGIGSS